jgi:protein TonB
MNPGHRLLPLCLGVSLVAHLAALLYLPDLAVPDTQAPGDAGLQVTLTRISNSTPAQAAAPAGNSRVTIPRPLRPAARPTPAEVEQRRQQTTTAIAQTAGSTASGDRPADTAAAAEPRIDAGSALLAELRTAMQPHFHYPLLARRRGWEGTVQVGLRISASGEITRLRIIKTSHHAVLDQAAIECLSKIRQMPGALAWLNGRDSDIVLPVEYRLTDS